MVWEWWQNLSNRAQSVSKGLAALVAIGGIVLGGIGYFQTDAEAQAYQQQHQSELVRFRVQQVEQQISQYQFQLLNQGLTPEQREWIKVEIQRLQELIKCIQAGKC